jgi:hypothetical protein
LRSKGRVLLLAVATSSALAIACGDLFHSTSFDTLCTVDASATGCSGDSADAAAGADEASTDAGATDFCAADRATAHTNASHACAWLTACEGPYDHNAPGQCMFDALQAFDCSIRPNMKVRGVIHDYWQCLLDAKSCSDVDKCVFGGPIGPCPATGGFNSCESNGVTRVACTATQGATPPALATNCAAQGRVCLHPMAKGSIAYCGASTLPPGGCTSGCKGSSIQDCNADAGISATIDTGRDCSNVGAGQCAPIEGPTGACVPTSTANDCGGAKDLACKNTTTVRDCRTGAQDIVDCAGLGGGCSVTGGVVPSGPAWDPSYACTGSKMCGADTCANGVITSCFHGIDFSIDCKAQGLPGCTTTADIPTGPDYTPSQTNARCTKP